MTTLFYVGAAGNYLGGFADAPPPLGAVEVPAPPIRADDLWNGLAWTPRPLTKDERIANILATQGQEKDRMTIQLAIQVAELIATIQAPAYSMTPTQAIAYAYSKNATYKRSKDTEAACRAVELEP